MEEPWYVSYILEDLHISGHHMRIAEDETGCGYTDLGIGDVLLGLQFIALTVAADIFRE